MAVSLSELFKDEKGNFEPKYFMSVVIVFFSLCFFLLVYCLSCKFSIASWLKRCKIDDVVRKEVAPKCVSAVQGFISTAVGVSIVLHCRDDIMYKRHWLTNRYAWFLWTYFYYDFAILTFTCTLRSPEVKKASLLQKFVHCTKSNPSMAFHHLVLPTVLMPTVVYFRRGMGDYFVGVFYAAELMSPFVNFHFILELLNMKKSLLYVVNGFATIVTFFIIRICVFPFMYWKFADYKNIPFWSVPSAIPLHCNIGTALPLGLMLYWLYCMVVGVIDHFTCRVDRVESKKE